MNLIFWQAEEAPLRIFRAFSQSEFHANPPIERKPHEASTRRIAPRNISTAYTDSQWLFPSRKFVWVGDFTRTPLWVPYCACRPLVTPWREKQDCMQHSSEEGEKVPLIPKRNAIFTLSWGENVWTHKMAIKRWTVAAYQTSGCSWTRFIGLWLDN